MDGWVIWVSGNLFWVDGGGWTFIMGCWELGGHFLWLREGGWECVEQFFVQMGVTGHLLWVGGWG